MVPALTLYNRETRLVRPALAGKVRHEIVEQTLDPSVLLAVKYYLMASV